MSVAKRLQPFGVTIFTEMTELARRHDAINLGQGYPDWEGAARVKEAAIESISSGDHDQYPPSPGVPELRAAIARRYSPRLGQDIDPDTDVTVTCGCTEALAASFLGLLDPGDEVVLIEPFYDSYPANAAMAGAVPRFVTLEPPDFSLDPDRLASVVGPATRVIVINNPHNPTGRVYGRSELQAIADLAMEFDCVVIADEVYEEMTYDGREHVSIATLDGMWDRTLTLSSLGKTYSLTGWKLGWALGPDHLTRAMRSAHQFLTFTTPTPVQLGAVAAMGVDDGFYEAMRLGYQAKRDLLVAGLSEVGFEVYVPEGTYFLMADHTQFGRGTDTEFCRWLAEEARVVAIPPSVFYSKPARGQDMVRFAFCKQEGTLAEAVGRLGILSVS